MKTFFNLSILLGYGAFALIFGNLALDVLEFTEKNLKYIKDTTYLVFVLPCMFFLCFVICINFIIAYYKGANQFFEGKDL